MSQIMGPRYTPSDAVVRMAQQYNLGRPLYEYKATVAQGGCGATVLLVIGIIALAASLSSSSAGAGIFGGACLLLGFLVLISTISRSGNRVFACTNGFVYKKGSEEQIVYWNNVEAIFQRIVKHKERVGQYTTYTYTIQQFDGSRLTFNDNMTPMEGLCNYIETSVAAQLMPKAIAAYQRGQNITFGSLAVNQQGIFNGKEWLAWNYVNGIRFHNGVISIKKTGKWLSWGKFFTPSIPNFTVFELLVDYIGRTRGW